MPRQSIQIFIVVRPRKKLCRRHSYNAEHEKREKIGTWHGKKENV